MAMLKLKREKRRKKNMDEKPNEVPPPPPPPTGDEKREEESENVEEETEDSRIVALRKKKERIERMMEEELKRIEEEEAWIKSGGRGRGCSYSLRFHWVFMLGSLLQMLAFGLFIFLVFYHGPGGFPLPWKRFNPGEEVSWIFYYAGHFQWVFYLTSLAFLVMVIGAFLSFCGVWWAGRKTSSSK